jgi:acyl-CoA synthetase (AMP-forming)/AMP-acid ligase II
MLDFKTETPTEFRRRIEAEPLPENLGALLDLAIERYGDNPAWIHVDQDIEPLTYRGLGELVARSANAFATLGVRKGTHVGVMLPNIPESLAAWLGLARLGARMIPINPGYTSDELRYWLTDGDAEWLLITDSCLASFDAMQAQGHVLDKSRLATFGEARTEGLVYWTDLLAKASPCFVPTERVDLDDVVNIQYTSGSTGWPKGCLLPHRYWIQAGKVLSEAWPKFTRIQCDLPFYYMGPLWRFALAAFQGAALCVPPSYSLSRFRERIRDYEYDMGWVTNPVAMLAPDPIERDNKLKMIAIFGLSKELHRPLEERYGVPVRESFGMTEIAFSIYMPFDDAHMSGSGSCGIATPFRELMIADTEGKPVERGEIGELCIRGKGILQGYYKKPEATAAAFHGDWFRSGDLFRQDANGYYYIVGRIKDMIRRSAENISVSEVESALSTLPAIQEAAVHGVKDQKRGEEVKACIVLHPEFTPDMVTPQAIIAHCREHLARFKVPRYVQYYRAFPRTGSNKIAKKRLVDGEGETLTATFDGASSVWLS